MWSAKKLLNINRKTFYWLAGIWLCQIPASSFAQNFVPLGSGINNTVDGLLVDTANNLLYASGNFTSAGGVSVCELAKWNGNSWDSVPGDCNIESYCLTIYNDTLYLGGPGVYKWDGTKFDTIATFSYGGPIDFLKYNNELYAFGDFDSINGIAATKMAKWDGTTWSAIDTTKWLGGEISCAIIYQGELYVGGNFVNYDGSIENLAKWNGTQWLPVGNNEMASGFGGVDCFGIYNGELYIGGLITKAYNQPGNAIAGWNGTQWDDVGGGMTSVNAQVMTLQVFNGELYAGGAFTEAGGIDANYIAKWNGTEWCSLGVTFNLGYDVLGMAVYNNELYIGGGFKILNGDTMNHVAEWIGGNYSDTCGTLSGIKEIESSINDFTIYPNPASSELNISAVFTYATSLLITITDIVGETLTAFKEEKFTGSFNKQINIANLSSGVYFVKMQSEGGVVVRKFVKE